MHIPVVIIGGGQSGLAMSYHLTARSIDHVVLEAGEVGQSWRTERWDSLRLLTPNWMSELPGHVYGGDDPDGFMTAAETVAFLDGYRRSFGAPVCPNTTVERVCARPCGFEVTTGQLRWTCDAVVAATGASSEPHVPALAAELPKRILQLTALQYRNPAQTLDGEVLVVGASASGVQIAEELQRNGRGVTLAVGEHVRLPRRYRGRDIYWWMNAIGQLDERYDEVEDLARARRLPSLQLVGSPQPRSVDLNALTDAGVGVVGRFMGVSGGRALFSGALANLVANADLKQNRLLSLIDEYVSGQGCTAELAGLAEPSRPDPIRLGAVPTELELGRFKTVVWATGYRPTYSWLDGVERDRWGRIVHDGGAATLPGLYLLGLPFLRRRRSSFIAGAGPDAGELAAHLHAYLDGVARR